MASPSSTMRRSLLVAGLAGSLGGRLAPAFAAQAQGWPALDTAPAVQVPNSHQFDVTVAGKTRRLFVALPAEPAGAAPHPVLTVLDGNALFPLAAQLVRNRRARPDGTPDAEPVVLGIGYPTDGPYDMAARVDDYTLAPLPDGRSLAADRFLDFIEHEVQPWLARQVSVDPVRKTLFGHSYGGLLTLYAMLTRPHLFGRYVAASPSIWWGDRALLPYADRFAAQAAPLAPALRLLVTAGSREEDTSNPDAERMRRQQARRQVSSAGDFVRRVGRRPGLDAAFHLIDGEDHGGVVVPSAMLAARIAGEPATGDAA
ncbi:esterase [Burkholderia sp. MSh2]|uniref:Acyl-CoA:diacylglycerol acyltransferase n=1 Tax=Burkholderia paludis TaxID=1506587 RepID=A0A6J5CUX0_9BURK|nr:MULTISPECIES: alpha/beta hydrolase-fold protein [Burkholderia]KEZ01376.1 esterase [Burkholderia sp. MSh2]CAB3745768.1 Ferri-bacillibactin esterase BesA [Burkholderia paludis]VWB21544.1 esterase [Burkholderia paludis]